MSSAEAQFWREQEKYHDLAEQFEQNIERTHPYYVDSRGMCVCLDLTSYCTWATTSVDYYEYRGERI
jgi:hypothetical protein